MDQGNELREYTLPVDVSVARRRWRRLAAIAVPAVVLLLALVVVAALRMSDLTARVVLALIAAGLVVPVVIDLVSIRRGLFAATRHPPQLGPEGIRLRVFAKAGHDLLVPWPEVSQVEATPWKKAGRLLLVHVADVKRLDGVDPAKLRRLRRVNDGPGVVLSARFDPGPTGVADLDAVVRRLTDGRLSLADTE